MIRSRDKQFLRSRAFRALAQDDMPERALEKEGGKSRGLSGFLFYDEKERVILSAEGAKDLLLVIANG